MHVVVVKLLLTPDLTWKLVFYVFGTNLCLPVDGSSDMDARQRESLDQYDAIKCLNKKIVGILQQAAVVQLCSVYI